jgi:cytochrome c oxidase assembly factor CtaG
MTLGHVAGGPLEPIQLLAAGLAVAAYYVRARHLSIEARPVPLWRQLAFYAGVLLIVTTLASPLGHIAEELLFVHMIEHLLVADIGALLLVLGVTGPVLQPILKIRLFDRLRVLAHPAVALPIWALNLYVWHLPVLYEAALRSEGVHAIEHLLFIGCGFNMWMPLFGPLPKPQWFGNLAKVGYIVAVRLTGALLGNVFVWSGSVFYSYYGRGEAYWGISALRDQGLAGSVMMIEGSFLTIGLFAWLFLKSARESDERQGLLDFASAHGLSLSEERAGRAVAAGQGTLLRQRLEESASTVVPDRGSGDPVG